MCNIAGYIGNKQAAPILLEMLRKQQSFDGGFSVGIATIHQGKLYSKKILGTVEDFEKQFDISEFPGTIGIAHTRPANSYLEHAHPFVSNDGAHALVLNGIVRDDELCGKRNKIADWVSEKGYSYRSRHQTEKSTFPMLSDGDYVASGEVLVNLVEIYMKQGMSLHEAHARAAGDMYSERVSVTVSADTPDCISVARITRPMEVLLGDGETYIASTRFAFPEACGAMMMSLPTMQICEITRDGVKVSGLKIDGDAVPEVTPLSDKIAYDTLVELLSRGKENAVVFDDCEIALENTGGLWQDKKRYTQHARLAYDILWQLHKEGRLKRFIGPQKMRSGIRQSTYMYIE